MYSCFGQLEMRHILMGQYQILPGACFFFCCQKIFPAIRTLAQMRAAPYRIKSTRSRHRSDFNQFTDQGNQSGTADTQSRTVTDDPQLRYQGIRCHNHPVHGPGSTPQPPLDMPALKGGTCGTGTTQKTLWCCHNNFSICTQIQDQGRFSHLVRIQSQYRCHGISTYKTGFYRRHMDLSSRSESQSD